MTYPTRAKVAQSTDLIRLHMQAVNGLQHALQLLQAGELTPPAMTRAIGKARRGVTAMKRLASGIKGGAQ